MSGWLAQGPVLLQARQNVVQVPTVISITSTWILLLLCENSSSDHTDNERHKAGHFGKV